MKSRLKNKKGFELSFGMIFSIIAGAVIIFLAVYTVSRLVTTNQNALYSESAQSLANILNPIANDISISMSAPDINFKKQTKVYLDCYAPDYRSPVFGRQTISFSEESGFLGGWTSPGANISRSNKYIFGENEQSGKAIHIFSKPFFVGYKVDDLVFLTMNNYCFVAPPESIKEEIENLKINNINITSEITKCKKDSYKVCFDFLGECNATVYPDYAGYETGKVIKSGINLYYTGSLLYAAIFSSTKLYECNVKRLGAKASELARLYKEKIAVVKSNQCNSLIENNLDAILGLAENLSSSKLNNLNSEAKIMDTKNCGAECQIYSGENC